MSELAKWLRGPQARPDVETQLEALAFDRLRLFLPVAFAAIVISLIVSPIAGIQLSSGVIAVNVAMGSLGIGMYVALRARRIPSRHAHATGALVWLLLPINTLTTWTLTADIALALPLMIELASAALFLQTSWTLLTTLPVLAIGLVLAHGNLAYQVCIAAMWLVAFIMQAWLRRWTIRAETHRLDLEEQTAQLAKELAERKRAQSESERAQAESERLRDQFVHAQRMDAVGTLAAGLAHDMNNILGGILAFSEVLYAETTNKDVKADLARIRQEAERGAQLTRSLLAFSRRGQYRKRSLLLHSVLDDMMPLLSRTLGTHIQVARTDGPPTIIEGDSAQLGQVLLNLCLNAKDAMTGVGLVTITTDEVDLAAGQIDDLPAGRYAKLTVCDTGTGMDAETKKRAFEPFFTTKPVGKGTGLGLAMVIGAVQAHGGAIALDSEIGKGTTISIYIPASEASPALPISEPVTTPRRSGLVLVVDDEPVVRTATARLVEQLGLAAVTAGDGDQAVAIYKERKDEIVLVLLDMVMPKMPGPECYKELRKIGRTPILLVSGFAADMAAQDLLETGADGFIEKPYSREDLSKEIDRLLGHAPAFSMPTRG